ncbi:unnamed protein product [Prorocentrum cordatum]|uniref:Uncharacterized protein n=1 Tax=Prorocentrum cordatum TaxID=2364126 RepID=A0ABN9TSP7_9DINO|nr:unnamed protein product [Polarella glacialis]
MSSSSPSMSFASESLIGSTFAGACPLTPAATSATATLYSFSAESSSDTSSETRAFCVSTCSSRFASTAFSASSFPFVLRSRACALLALSCAGFLSSEPLSACSSSCLYFAAVALSPDLSAMVTIERSSSLERAVGASGLGRAIQQHHQSCQHPHEAYHAGEGGLWTDAPQDEKAAPPSVAFGPFAAAARRGTKRAHGAGAADKAAAAPRKQPRGAARAAAAGRRGAMGTGS